MGLGLELIIGRLRFTIFCRLNGFSRDLVVFVR